MFGGLRLVKMHDEIKNCNDYVEGHCKNANGKHPLVMKIPESCRIVLVSQAPSRNASAKQILADRYNKTFIQLLEVLGIEEEQFHEYVYWTHYGKCYPGKREGGDQWITYS